MLTLENVKDLGPKEIPYGNKYFRISSKHSLAAYTTAQGNCKHCYLDNIKSIKPKEDIESLNKILARKLTFSINITSVDTALKWCEVFKLIDFMCIPTGYSTGFQYHAIFLTNDTNYTSYSNYKQRIKEQPDAEERLKDLIKTLPEKKK